jgi:hypothetical protein
MKPTAGTTPIATSRLLAQRLELVYRWYEGMVNAKTGMFEYLYVPDTDAFMRRKSPIRDLGSVWDAEVLGDILGRDTLRPLIDKSLRHYARYVVERDGRAILDSHRLEEPSSIAHSAFMILALLHDPARRDVEKIAALAEGILRQQRGDGSYKVYFEALADEGEELYAGEAMLALGEWYGRSADGRCLRSVEKAFAFYDGEYFGRGRVTDDVLVFFANWQSQACRLLFEQTANATVERDVAAYLQRMHDRVIELGFYAGVASHPERQVSVEVACALEGLNDAYAVARAASDEDTVARYRSCICAGLAYLLDLQCTHSARLREVGGFGMSFGERTQRIDVTGHAASAFMKTAANGIECG